MEKTANEYKYIAFSNFLASEQFKAKSEELHTLSAHQLVRVGCGDWNNILTFVKFDDF